MCFPSQPRFGKTSGTAIKVSRVYIVYHCCVRLPQPARDFENSRDGLFEKGGVSISSVVCISPRGSRFRPMEFSLCISSVVCISPRGSRFGPVELSMCLGLTRRRIRISDVIVSSGARSNQKRSRQNDVSEPVGARSNQKLARQEGPPALTQLAPVHGQTSLGTDAPLPVLPGLPAASSPYRIQLCSVFIIIFTRITSVFFLNPVRAREISVDKKNQHNSPT